MSTLIVPMVQINEINKHPNADTLSIAKFEGFGWQSIIKTGQYKVGDWVIFVPPDAMIPRWIINDQQITYLKSKVGRVGAVRLRGELSEGVVLPTDIFDRNPLQTMGDASPMAGEDVSERLGIYKYEPDVPTYASTAKAKKTRSYNNLTFPIYTDIQHLKNFPEAFTEDDLVVITEKIHGTNFRAGWALKQHISLVDRIKRLLGKYDPFYFTCGSRRVEMGLDKPHTTWYDKRNLKRKFFEYNLYQKWAARLKNVIPYGYIFYGEIYGDKVQDLSYGLTNGETKVVIFDVMKDGYYLSYNEMIALVNHKKLDCAPLLYVGKYSAERVAVLTNGKSLLALTNGCNQIREGVVVKSFAERVDPVMGRAIYKSVSVEYLNRKDGTEYQ
jgi:RNA ligase (TIGR02306 family)